MCDLCCPPPGRTSAPESVDSVSLSQRSLISAQLQSESADTRLLPVSDNIDYFRILTQRGDVLADLVIGPAVADFVYPET